jgi:DNA polymerase III subunit alpha
MIQIHAHNSDSVLDGIGTQKQYAKLAYEKGQYALAETNHGVLTGSLKHLQACNEVGIMPILGMEGYWRPNRLVRDKGFRYKKWHMILLAKNLRGWHNLIKLSSESFASGFYQSPCFDWKLQEKYREGIVCTTSCISGPLSFLIENGNDYEVDSFVEKSLKIYGDDFYFAISPHNFDRQRAVNLEIVSLANRYGCPVVYEGDIHYPYEGWVETQKIAILTAMNKTAAEAEEANKKRVEKGEETYELWHDGLHLMDEPEVRKAFADFHPNLSQSVVDESIRSTDEIGAKIEPFLMDRSTKMPRARNSERTVTKWCREGMERIGKVGNKVYEERLAYELKVIKIRKNFNYFFITIDWVKWCRSDSPLPGDSEKKKPMRLGSGRGSVTGSLVSYLCEITTLDPIAYKLKFERFLNPERKGLPDIDVDIPSTRRNEAKEYLARKYGENHIADVIAQQHFTPVMALKSSAKALHGFDSDCFNEIAKICHRDYGLVDPVHDSDLEKMCERIPQLQEWAQRWPVEWREAVRLENAGEPFVSRISKHAAAVLITPEPVTNFMPVIRSDENEVGFRTAWPETPRISIVEDFGFVKWDALGLKGMDQQQMIVDSVYERSGESIDLDKLPALTNPYDVDEKVMKAFQDGHTLGTNQFPGEGITSYIKRANPENIIDLAAVNALYRPGPMGEQGHCYYADRKNGKEEYTIPEILKPYLSETYSVLAFQESVTDLFEVLAGYSPGESDSVRKIIAKIYREKGSRAEDELNKHKDRFINKSSEKIGLKESERYWEEILPYTDYSFNKSHSSGYAIQAFQDQWLKIYYPLDFYSVIMTIEPKNSLKAIKEAKHFGISILPPDVNISDNNYTPDFDNKALRYGLRGIKGIADASADQVMKLRPYSSLGDFCARNEFKYSKVNKGHREKLHDVGALDSLGGRAGWSSSKKAQAEIELLGMALSAGGTLGDDEALVISKTHSEEEYKTLEIGAKVVIGGVISKIKNTVTKKGKNPGQKMAFLEVSLGLDSFNCTLFPEQYEANKEFLKVRSKVMVNGNKDNRGIIVSDMMWAEDFVNSLKTEMSI